MRYEPILDAIGTTANLPRGAFGVTDGVSLRLTFRHKKATSSEMASSLGLYVKPLQRWAAAGLQRIKLDVYDVRNLGQRVPIQIEL